METFYSTQTPNIPISFQHVKKSLAARIMEIPPSSFYRKYIDSGLISTIKNHQGKELVPFSELIRIFGEEAIQKFHKFSISSQNLPMAEGGIPNSFQNNQSIIIERIRLEEEIKHLQQRLHDREEWVKDRNNQLEEKNRLLQEQRDQIRTLENKVYGLLENRKNDHTENNKKLLEQSKTSRFHFFTWLTQCFQSKS